MVPYIFCGVHFHFSFIIWNFCSQLHIYTMAACLSKNAFCIQAAPLWICLTHKATLVSAAGWDTGYLQEATAQGAGNAKLNPARGQPSSRERLPIQQRRHEARENRPVGKEPPPIVTGIVQVPYAPPTGMPCLRATFAAGALEGSDALHFARRVSMSLRFLLRTRRNRWDNGSSSGPGPVGQPSFGCCKVLEHSLYLLIDC